MLMTPARPSNTQSYRCLRGIYQFNAVAEGVVQVAAPHPGDIRRLVYLHSGGLQLRNQIVVVRALKREMCLLCIASWTWSIALKGKFTNNYFKEDANSISTNGVQANLTGNIGVCCLR